MTPSTPQSLRIENPALRPSFAAWFAGLMFVLAGCAGKAPEEAESETASPGEAEVARVETLGREAAAALMQSLGGQLKAAMEADGPVAAIAVCQTVAQPLTAAAGAGIEGAEVRRTTLRPRNPLNAPDEIDREVLAAMEAGAGEAPLEPVIRWEKQTARYYAPIVIQEVCLNCHGDVSAFPAPLVERLDALYPDDEATGYALGDFRGAVRVDVVRGSEP